MQRAPQQPPAFAGDSDELGGVALFFDVENILLGIQGDFDVGAVTRFLGERGEVMILRAYADWGRYRRQQRHFLEEGVQMVFLPTYGASDKNRTDTAICVDAMEILYTRPLIDTYCIVSGDSDFGILAQRLRDHGKRVIGMSARSAASPVLVKQCHEFVFYETLIGQRVAGFSVEEGEERVKRALARVVEEVGPEFRAGVLKDRMRKQDPTFSERNYGASSFTRFLANYDHLLVLGEGGTVHVVPEAARPQPVAAKGPERGGANPEKVARGVLLRTVIEAAQRHGPQAIPLSRLKDTMQAVAPEFDELALGYKSFTSFLQAFPDLVVVDRTTNSARPNEGILPPEVEVSRDEGARAGPERRRRTKKTAGAAPEPGDLPPVVDALEAAGEPRGLAPRSDDAPAPGGAREEPKAEKPREEAKAEKPREEAKAEKPREEAKAEKPREEAKAEKPREEAKAEKPREEAKAEKPREEPKARPIGLPGLDP